MCGFRHARKINIYIKNTLSQSSVEIRQIPRPFLKILHHCLVGVSSNRGENFRMKCICGTAVGGRRLWFANQDGDFWTTATVWQRQPATGLSAFKAKGPLSLTVGECLYSHTSRDGTSRRCCCCRIVRMCTCTLDHTLGAGYTSTHRQGTHSRK